MKKYEMLEKAMRDYPAGTKFKEGDDVYTSNGVFIITPDTFVISEQEGEPHLYHPYTKQWAEIVKEEHKRVFFRNSEDGVDLYVGDYAHWVGVSPNQYWYNLRLEENHLKYDFINTYRLFSTKEAAENWIEEQNKPKEVKLTCTGGEVVVTKTTVRFNVLANREFSGTFFDKIVEARKSLQS